MDVRNGDRIRKLGGFLSLSLSLNLFSLLSSRNEKKVDRNNFDEGLAALRAALAVGDFYALDCEFTGVENGGDRNDAGPPPLRPASCDAVPRPTTTDDPRSDTSLSAPRLPASRSPR